MIDPLGWRRRAGVETDAPDRLKAIGTQGVAGVADDAWIGFGARGPASREIAEAGEVAENAFVGPGLRWQILLQQQLDRTALLPSRLLDADHAQAIGVQGFARLVDRSPEQRIADRRKHLGPIERMAAGGGDPHLDVERTLALPGGGSDVSEAQRQRHCGRQPRVSAHGEDEPDQQNQGQRRANGGDPVPGHTQWRERPQQVRPIIGARVEHGMRGVADGGRGDYRPPVRAMALPRQPGRRSHDAADRNERQGMREVAVVLDRQQGVRRTPDQDIGIRQHTADGAEQPRLAAKTRAEGNLCRGRAEQRMGQGVHKLPAGIAPAAGKRNSLRRSGRPLAGRFRTARCEAGIIAPSGNIPPV